MTSPLHSSGLAEAERAAPGAGPATSPVVFPVVQGKDGWRVERRGRVIFATFKGSLSGSDGFDSAHRCVELLGEDDACLVFDLFGLHRYESRVRTDWQTLISPHASQFSCIYAGATNALVRMGMTTFGLTARVTTKVFTTRADLEQALAEKAALE